MPDQIAANILMSILFEADGRPWHHSRSPLNLRAADPSRCPGRIRVLELLRAASLGTLRLGFDTLVNFTWSKVR